MAEIRNLLRTARIAQGLSQSDLARRAGISRQALGAIESGGYQPGVSVALKLARVLGRTVEDLFGESSENLVSARITAEDAQHAGIGTHVALARVRGKLVAVPIPPAEHRLAIAAGMVESARARRAQVASYRSPAEIDATLLIAGCDPSVVLLSDWITRHHAPARVAPVTSGSERALAALAQGRVHAAGVHLCDTKSGDYNVAAVRRALGSHHATVISFARWEIGIAVAAHNPLNIRGFEDMARRQVKIVNREPGSGARIALDDALSRLKLSRDRIAGYRREASGHLEVSAAIAGGLADMGVTLKVAADAYGLGFIPIREERYDLAIGASDMETSAVQVMLEALNSGHFAREVAALCGYDTRAMGTVVAAI